MKTRVITGIVALVLFLPFAIFSWTPALVVFTVIATVISIFEMCGCMRQRKSCPIVFVLSEVYGILCALSTRLSSEFAVTFLSLTAVYAVLIMGYAMFSKGKYTFDQAVEILFGIVYVTFGYCSIVLVRDLPYGEYVFWLIFLAAWLSDTGAYFAGMTLGKHKLIPDISPKKTVEGFVGGILSCILIFLLYGWMISLFTEHTANYLALIVAGLLLSLVSVFGDLLASYIKRRHKVKDYGAILPGHGGFLDRFDSVLAVSILLYIFCKNATFMPLFGPIV
ncbi:MAG: phosphatidate cytidylyltransferase [Eubacteriales bacterium]